MIDWRRAAVRRPQTIEIDGGEIPVGDVEEDVIDGMAIDRVHQVLETLTDEQREVILLRVVADLSLKATARVMGKSVGAIKAMQRRALVAVKAQLEERGVSQ
jgi:RNA polymerase sigma-70 factor (ECF subfamily)